MRRGPLELIESCTLSTILRRKSATALLAYKPDAQASARIQPSV